MKQVRHFEGYQACQNYWDEEIRSRSKKTRVAMISLGESNTNLLKYPDSSFSVVYYETPIINFYPDGSIELDHGGHKTRTTKSRMNMFMPTGMSVIANNDTWYVYEQWKTCTLMKDGVSYLKIIKDTKGLWDFTKPFTERGRCLISAEEMLLYSLGKVQT